MIRRALGVMAAVAVVVTGVFADVNQAEAFGWRRWGGSSGGSYGSYGSCGGSYGSYGGSSGGWHHHRAYYGGSWGSYGSYGGYSYGCSGGHYYGGSSGGSSGGYYSYPGVIVEGTRVPTGAAAASSGTANPMPPTTTTERVPMGAGGNPMPMNPGTPELPPVPRDPLLPEPNPNLPRLPAPATPGVPALPGPGASLDRGSATIHVAAPVDAKIFINDRATSSVGSQRQFVSRNLQAGFDYAYDVRVEFVLNGEPVTETRTVTLRAGGEANLAFHGEGTQVARSVAKPLETTLILKVPADAKVSLEGADAGGTGTTRTFTTTQLSAGETWSNYRVSVSIERDGKQVLKTQTVTLKAGEQQTLAVDFDAPKVAAAGEVEAR